MKKIYLSVLALLLSLFIPTKVFAQTKNYQINNNSLSINFDTSEWYVFTRENLSGNKELEELGIEYDYLNNFMQTNKVYLDAVLFYDNEEDTTEFLIRINPNNSLNNLSNYSDEDVEEFALELAKLTSTTEYSIYKNNYKYAYLEYKDSGYNIIQYSTVVNGEAYSIQAQKINTFREEEKANIKGIVDTIKFTIEPSLAKEKSSIDWKKIVVDAICGGIIGGLIALIYNKVSLKKKSI